MEYRKAENLKRPPSLQLSRVTFSEAKIQTGRGGGGGAIHPEDYTSAELPRVAAVAFVTFMA